MTTVRHPWLNTTVGVLVVALLLFPVYWMVNASLQPNGATLDTTWLPLDPDLSGYRTAIAEQGGNLVTSLVVALGSVVVILLIAVPAAYVLAQFDLKWANWVLFGILISQMIPGIVVANALYAA